jgi:molybdopterin molybdotransferase
MDPDQALALVLARAPGPQPQRRLLVNAVGAVLLEPIRAAVAQPPFSKSMMDGFAVRCADAGSTVTRIGEVAAGDAPGQRVEPGQAVEIMTGAPCPAGTEAVVKVEDVRREGAAVILPPVIEAGQHIQAEGALCRPGDEVLPAGDVLTPVALATAVAVGCREAVVSNPPTVALITTGDELAEAGGSLRAAEIYDSNGPMLEALSRLAGAEHVRRLHAGDTRESLHQALSQADDADLVVLSGGVSMGRYDLVPESLAEHGWTQVFHKTSQKPGKPILFAQRGDQLAFGLPGTPLGSHFGFHRYVAAVMRKRLGQSVTRPIHRGTLSRPLRSRGERTLFRLARAHRLDTTWRVDPLRWGGSSDLVGPGRANCYLRLEPGEHHLAAGAEVSFELVDGAAEENHA